MQPTLCSRCHKNVAVIFISKLEGGETKNEGLCLKCARELGIKPIDDMMKKMGISDEDLDNLTNEMMSAFGGAEGMEGLLAQPDGGGDEQDDGRTATFPFLSQLFGGGPAETEIIDRIGYPIGASATSNGVTITADAIMGDTYSYAIVYSIRRDDGSPLVSDETLAAGAERDGLLPLRFRNYGTQVRTSGGGAHGSSWFYDADPADNAIQFVEMMTQDQPLKPGTASVKFQDLSVYTDNDYRTSETLAEGTWRLKFDFAFEDSSISLPAGQSFTLNGMDATLDGVTLSPLSIQVDYTVHQELVWSENRESGRENEYDREQSYRYFESLPVVITYTDGTTQDLTNAGGGITPGDGETVCQKSRIFDELRPLDEVASVTVGDIVLPVSAG